MSTVNGTATGVSYGSPGDPGYVETQPWSASMDEEFSPPGSVPSVEGSDWHRVDSRAVVPNMVESSSKKSLGESLEVAVVPGSATDETKLSANVPKSIEDTGKRV